MIDETELFVDEIISVVYNELRKCPEIHVRKFGKIISICCGSSVFQLSNNGYVGYHFNSSGGQLVRATARNHDEDLPACYYDIEKPGFVDNIVAFIKNDFKTYKSF